MSPTSSDEPGLCSYSDLRALHHQCLSPEAQEFYSRAKGSRKERGLGKVERAPNFEAHRLDTELLHLQSLPACRRHCWQLLSNPRSHLLRAQSAGARGGLVEEAADLLPDRFCHSDLCRTQIEATKTKAPLRGIAAGTTQGAPAEEGQRSSAWY